MTIHELRIAEIKRVRPDLLRDYIDAHLRQDECRVREVLAACLAQEEANAEADRSASYDFEQRQNRLVDQAGWS